MKWSATTLVMVLTAASVRGEDATLQIPRVNHPPHLEDYVSGKAPPEAAKVTEFRQRDPNDGDRSSYPTEAYLSYDDKDLFVVFVCHDAPGQVRAHMAKREDIGDDDAVFLYLDTFRDRQRAYVFSVNPLGIQRDGIQTEGAGKPDYSYDTLWRSEGRLTEDGYVVW